MRSTACLRARSPCSTAHLGPRRSPLRRRHRHGAREVEQARRPRKDGAPAFDSEHDLIALDETKCIANRLRHRHLALGRELGCNIHAVVLLTYGVSVRIEDPTPAAHAASVPVAGLSRKMAVSADPSQFRSAGTWPGETRGRGRRRARRGSARCRPYPEDVLDRDRDARSTATICETRATESFVRPELGRLAEAVAGGSEPRPSLVRSTDWPPTP